MPVEQTKIPGHDIREWLDVCEDREEFVAAKHKAKFAVGVDGVTHLLAELTEQ